MNHEKLPKKYCSDAYDYNKDGILINVLTNEKVIKNKSVLDKPKLLTFSGNKAYSSWHFTTRIKVVNFLQDYLSPYVESIGKIVEFPIQIEMELHCPPNNCDWDLDNLWLYNKVFQDLLHKPEHGLNIIPEDHIKYITKPGAFEYYPISNDDERKIVFNIYKDNREVVKNHIIYRPQKGIITMIKNSDFSEFINSHILFVNDLQADGYNLIEGNSHNIPKIHKSLGKNKATKAKFEESITHLKKLCINSNRDLLFPILRDLPKSYYLNFLKLLTNNNINVHIYE